MYNNDHTQEVDVDLDRRPLEALVANVLCTMLGSISRPTIIAVGGPGGAGKSTLAGLLANFIPDASVLALDHYKTSREDRRQAGIYGAHPKANRMALITDHLQMLRRARSIDRPVYCPQLGDASETRVYTPRQFNIVEGEVATYKEFRHLVDFSIFVDADWRTQLNTRITRDIDQRGYSPEKAIKTFLHSNLREFTEYGQNSKKWADLCLYCQSDYSLSIESASSEVIKHLRIMNGSPV